MKYILSQSFHTLNHWQSGKRGGITPPVKIDYLPTTSWSMIGIVDGSHNPCLFPYGYKTADAADPQTITSGCQLYGSSNYPLAATPNYGGIFLAEDNAVAFGLFILDDETLEPVSVERDTITDQEYSVLWYPMTRKLIDDKPELTFPYGIGTSVGGKWRCETLRHDESGIYGNTVKITQSKLAMRLWVGAKTDLPDEFSDWNTIGELGITVSKYSADTKWHSLDAIVTQCLKLLNNPKETTIVPDMKNWTPIIIPDNAMSYVAIPDNGMVHGGYLSDNKLLANGVKPTHAQIVNYANSYVEGYTNMHTFHLLATPFISTGGAKQSYFYFGTDNVVTSNAYVFVGDLGQWYENYTFSGTPGSYNHSISNTGIPSHTFMGDENAYYGGSANTVHMDIKTIFRRIKKFEKVEDFAFIKKARE